VTHPTDPATMQHGDRAPDEPVTLAGFVKARLDETEAAALAVQDSSEPWSGQWEAHGNEALRTHNGWVLLPAGGYGYVPGLISHIALHDPSRVLREVEAGRKLLAAYQAAVDRQAAAAEGRAPAEPEWHIARRAALDFAVAVRAAIWSDHPDFGSWAR
jgi:Family of unknown function (DUF6221)